MIDIRKSMEITFELNNLQVILGWLLNADPAIRWQVLHDLVPTSSEITKAERARVGSAYVRSCRPASIQTAA